MDLGVFELDNLGIIPLDGETKEDFLKRGNLIYTFAKEASVGALKVFFDDYSAEFALLEFEDHEGKVKEEVEYLKRNYGVNLSWVRFLRLYPHKTFLFFKTLSCRGCV